MKFEKTIKEKYFRCFSILIFFCFSDNHTFVAGQPHIIKVPEGICDCPKKIAVVSDVYYPSKTDPIPCYIDSVHFASPNGLRTPNKPQLFGLNWLEDTTTTTATATITTQTPNSTGTANSSITYTTVKSSDRNSNSESPLTYDVTASAATITNDVTSATYHITNDGKNTKLKKETERSNDVTSTTLYVTSDERDLSSTGEIVSPQTYKSTVSHMTSSKFDASTDVTIATTKPYVVSAPAQKVFDFTMTSSANDVTSNVKPVSETTMESSKKTLQMQHGSMTSPRRNATPRQSSTISSTVLQTTISAASTPDYTTFTASGSGAPPGGIGIELLQTFDLDREKTDKHLVSVQCNEQGSVILSGIFVIEVTDINDNTPVFDKTSLLSTVPASLNLGDALLYLKATDADIGENAELKFGWVKGTERITFRNGTKSHYSNSVVVLPTGFVILLGNLIPDSEVTFAVTVKDRGDHSDGNRATATATVTVYDTLPISTPTHETSPKPTSASPSRSDINSWLPYVIISLVVVFLSFVALLVVYLRRKRSRSRFRRPMLVIDDSSLIDNDEDFTRFGDHSINRDSRFDPSAETLRRHDSSDEEILNDLARSES